MEGPSVFLRRAICRISGRECHCTSRFVYGFMMPQLLVLCGARLGFWRGRLVERRHDGGKGGVGEK